MIQTTGLHHVRITVTDLARSRAFYTDVLGFEVAAESPGSPDDPEVRNDPAQLYGGVVFQTNGTLSRDELVAARDGEVQELADFGLAILSFSDPDGLHLELTAAL